MRALAAAPRKDGNANFNITDPDGHTVEIVQYFPSGWTVRDQGKAVPASRISDRMLHVGVIVNSLQPAMEFYRNILGFEEIWRGSGNDTTLGWVNMKVPDGGDHVEFMLHDPVPEPTKRGVAHHICRGRRYGKAVATLGRRAEATGYTKPIEVRTGRNRRKQMNLYDPDGTRTELMEPRTVDGQPASSSTLPPQSEPQILVARKTSRPQAS